MLREEVEHSLFAATARPGADRVIDEVHVCDPVLHGCHARIETEARLVHREHQRFPMPLVVADDRNIAVLGRIHVVGAQRHAAVPIARA